MQRMLWRFVEASKLHVHPQGGSEIERMWKLMEQYRDHPMSFPDASLVVAAETLGTQRIFTLDSHFYSYLINDKAAFEVIP